MALLSTNSRCYALLCIIVCTTSGLAFAQSLLCTQDFCDDYKLTVGCPSPVNTACAANNLTHSGYLFPSATPCSCCNDCLEHIKLGEYCSIGAPGSPLPNSYCGPGLICKQLNTDEHPQCVPMYETDCNAKQIAYDLAVIAGTIGKLMQRPLCDENGNFAATVCVPGQICHCVDLKGKRIFGESANTEFIQTKMRCECTRMSSLFSEIMTSKYPQMMARCLDDGSFDPLQCIGDQCMCVNRFNGSLEGVPNTNQILNPLRSMPCFDRNLHSTSTYMHECEAENFDKVSEALGFEADGVQVLSIKFSVCDENGWYNRVQEDSTHKFCADKFGNVIGNYNILKTSDSAHNMNCHCARARELVPSIGECCPNGNFPKFVCDRDECYCINENGEQISKEVPADQVTLLSCNENGLSC